MYLKELCSCRQWSLFWLYSINTIYNLTPVRSALTFVLFGEWRNKDYLILNNKISHAAAAQECMLLKVKCNKKSIKKEKTSTTSRSFYVFFNLLLELTDSIRILRLFSAKLMRVEATLTRLIQVLARRNFKLVTILCKLVKNKLLSRMTCILSHLVEYWMKKTNG